jgi:beta-lactamase superfamily II metal-dependent hydrolase
VALDKAVNGTSLMLLFQVGRALLLFPGDAQWGTWKRAMDDPVWREMLGGLSFLKVGHHGSHNATPVTFVDEVARAPFTAMVSTRATKRYKEIPRRPLLERLMSKCPGLVVRSDDAQVAAPFERKGPLATETRVPI